MDRDTKEFITKLIENNSINSNEENSTQREKRQTNSLVSYVVSDDDSDADIFAGDDCDDLDFIPFKTEYDSDDFDISPEDIPFNKRKNKAMNIQENKRAKRISNEFPTHPDSHFDEKIELMNARKNGMDNNDEQKNILKSLELLQKETAKLEYRMGSIERNSSPFGSCNVLDSAETYIVDSQGPTLLLNIPLKTKSEADDFEIKLNDAKFRDVVITNMTEFYGNRKSTNTKQALITIINKIFSAELLCQFTWTGKSDPKQKENKKYPFKNMTEILDVVLKVMQQIDAEYTMEKLSRDITYKVLKYAYKFARPNKN